MENARRDVMERVSYMIVSTPASQVGDLRSLQQQISYPDSDLPTLTGAC